MYKINAKSTIRDTLLLTGRGLPKRIKVSIRLDAVAAVAQTAIKEVDRANEALQKEWNDANFAAFRGVMLRLYRIIFGDKNTDKMLAYFDDDFLAMAQATFPFLDDRIKPKLQKQAAAVNRSMI